MSGFSQSLLNTSLFDRLKDMDSLSLNNTLSLRSEAVMKLMQKKEPDYTIPSNIPVYVGVGLGGLTLLTGIIIAARKLRG